MGFGLNGVECLSPSPLPPLAFVSCCCTVRSRRRRSCCSRQSVNLDKWILIHFLFYWVCFSSFLVKLEVAMIVIMGVGVGR